MDSTRLTSSEVKEVVHNQGRIYIGASGSMAPGPEVLGGPFESKVKIWKTYFIKFQKAQAQTSTGEMLWGHQFKRAHHLEGPTTYWVNILCQIEMGPNYNENCICPGAEGGLSLPLGGPKLCMAPGTNLV